MEKPQEKPQDQPQKKSDQDQAQEFINEYQALCDKHGFQIVVVPAYKVSQDTGTWHTVLQTSVGKLSKRMG